MPQRSTSIRIPQPCTESWDAMTPAGLGRHCAACQKTVVDFSLKSDAEILAYLAKATGETCGRLRSNQLNRTLLPALGARPAARWRQWLALALAAWGLRASPAAATGAPAASPPTTAHPRKKASLKHQLPATAPRLLRGTVRAADTHEPLAGVAVFLKGENRSATTDTAGNFSLRLPAQRPRAGRALVLHYTGYQSETVPVAATAMQIELQADPAAAGATIMGYGTQQRTEVTGGMIAVIVEPPALRPQHPRSFWRWLTQSFW
jgi:hypothetical protein